MVGQWLSFRFPSVNLACVGEYVQSPTVVCINNETDIHPLKSASTLKNEIVNPKEPSVCHFSILEGKEDDQLELDACTDSIDLLLLPGKECFEKDRLNLQLKQRNYKCTQCHVAEVIEEEETEENTSTTIFLKVFQSKCKTVSRSFHV
ncbi:hypothetical protein Bca52824_031989 [Brassica carinata]|uniref:Uncharacterized protein n=1 Tax=Brassica carinata TaxID=52824 RepID=A0A8X7S949_BRACI|nr:hypothetical protein Bca52824_031989 [Brassica carinata]